jgi:hypothetical protein
MDIRPAGRSFPRPLAHTPTGLDSDLPREPRQFNAGVLATAPSFSVNCLSVFHGLCSFRKGKCEHSPLRPRSTHRRRMAA